MNKINSKKKITHTTNTESEIRRQIIELRRKAQIEQGVGSNTVWCSWFTTRSGQPARIQFGIMEHKRNNPALAAEYERQALDLEKQLFRVQNNLPEPVEEKIVIPLFRPKFVPATA